MAENFTAITTQEQFDNAIKDRLARATKTAEEKFSGFISPDDFAKKTESLTKQITDLQAALKAETDKGAGFTKEIAERDAKLKAYETASVKTRIAHETGLSYDAIDFLKGETEEDIKKSAASLKALMGPGSVAPPLRNNEPPAGDAKDAAFKTMLQELNL